MERAYACVATAEEPYRRNKTTTKSKRKPAKSVWMCVLYFVLWNNDDSEENEKNPSETKPVYK